MAEALEIAAVVSSEAAGISDVRARVEGMMRVVENGEVAGADLEAVRSLVSEYNEMFLGVGSADAYKTGDLDAHPQQLLKMFWSVLAGRRRISTSFLLTSV